MKSWNRREKRTLITAMGLVLGAAMLGNLLAGSGLDQWYSGLRHPSFAMPRWGFLLVGLLYYTAMIVVLFRTLVLFERRGAAGQALVLVLATMGLMELWNLLLFNLQNPLAALVGMGPLLLTTLAAGMALRRVDTLSARLMLLWFVWLLLYLTPWSARLWQLNP